MKLRFWRRGFKTEADQTRRARLKISLHGFECETYNKSAVYETLGAKATNSDVGAVSAASKVDESKPEVSMGAATDSIEGREGLDESVPVPAERQSVPAWMRHFPVIEIDIDKGKCVAGNRTIPITFTMAFKVLS